jgi:PAS domain S-box-containing protein
VIRGDGEARVGPHGNVERLAGTVMDVTEQDEMLRAVDRSEERLRSLAGTSSSWYWEQDAGARFTLFAGGRDGAAAPSGDFIGKCRWEIPRAQPLAGGWDDHRATLESGKPFTNFEYSAGDADDFRILSVTGEPMHDVQGQCIGYRGTARDVTAAKAAEGKSRDAVASLALATRLGRLGSWSVQAGDGAVTWSSEALAIHELDSDAGLSMRQAGEFIDPAWRASAGRAVQDCLVDGTAFDIEVQAVTARGRPLWIRLIGEAERDPDGAVRRIQGAVQDISERKEAAERYRTVSERLTLTLESITDAFFTLDRQWRFTYINPEAERIFGVGRGELLGQVVWDRYSISRGSTFQREYEHAMQHRATARFESYSEALGRWVQVVAYPSEQGLAVYFRDITESRNVRRALVESEERFRLLFASSVDPILQTSAEGKVLRANPAACAVLGSD